MIATMRWAWTLLLWISACGSSQGPTAAATAGDPDESSGGGEVASSSFSSSSEDEDAAEVPPEALRPEDAIGFARMDPSLDEMGCLPPEELDLEPAAWRLDGATLVWVPCRVGAYQPSGALFLVRDDGRTERLALPYADAEGGVLTDEATGEVRYDPSAGELVDLVRFRGLGDCGRQLRFRVSATGLTLLEHREQPCASDGEDAEHGGPETWPVRFPAQRP